MKLTSYDFGPGFPKVSLGIRRVYFYTDFIREVGWALRELRQAIWGCGWFHRHDPDTIRFSHVPRLGPNEWGTWWVNECRRCGRITRHASYSGPPR